MMPAALRAQEANPGKLTALYRKEFELCRVAAGETIACVSDLSTRRAYVHRGHDDVPMRDCSIVLDNDLIVDKGKIVDAKMIVERVRLA